MRYFSRGGSDSLMFSLSEFAFLLAFICLGILAVIYARLELRETELGLAESQLEAARQIVAEQKARLEELEGAVVPCWERPNGSIPRVAGIITILSPGHYILWDYSKGERELLLEAEQLQAQRTGTSASGAASGLTEVGHQTLIRGLEAWYSQSLNFARSQNCYLRVKIENRLDEHQPYEELVQVIARLGLVVAND